MKTTRLPGLHYWSVFQPDRRIDFNGFFVEREGANLLIDPMPLDGAQRAFVAERGGAPWILISNPHHLRDAGALAEHFGAQVLAPETDREAFEAEGAGIHGWFASSKDLPGAVAAQVDVHWIEGGKSPKEAVFELTQLNALVFGDAVRSHESGQLRLLPDPMVSDKSKLAASVKALGAKRPEAILLGDGDSLFNGAAETLHAFASGL